jgi:hypothetical protein
MSIATDSRGPFAENTLRGLVFRFVAIRFLAQTSHRRTVSYTSSAIRGQKQVRRMVGTFDELQVDQLKGVVLHVKDP